MKKIGLIFLFLLLARPVGAISEAECTTNWRANLDQCLNLWDDLQRQAEKKTKSLKNDLLKINAGIAIAAAQILQTGRQIDSLEQEIDELTGKIGQLDSSLNNLSQILLERIRKTYQRGSFEPLALFLSAGDFKNLISHYKYLRVVQLHDRQLLIETETIRTAFDDQKKLKEKKQAELSEAKKRLEDQKIVLAQQKNERQFLLTATQNDEKRYQSLLEEARRELQAVLASKFSEKRYVARGEVIGVMGNTGFSRGAHLHFGVYNLREDEAGQFDYYSRAENPFAYLAARGVLFDAAACDDTPVAVTKTVGSGGWNWPMGNPRLTQCFGHTPWSRWYKGDFHHGIDLVDKEDTLVRAAEAGEAYYYRGEGSLGNNVRIFHSNGKMTLYLHLQ
jgi:murein DD-endopeptidase MepM/ murein hydrolase activator NlpD